MASRFDRSMLLAGVAATALSAAGWWFGAQLHPVWWLTWLAPLPLLWLATRVRARWAALAALLAITTGDLPYWAYTHIGLPIPETLTLIVIPALILMLAMLLYRRLSMQGRYLAAAFAFPVVAVAGHFANGAISANGTWLDIGYTQMDALPIIQVAALTGVVGVGFLVMLGPVIAATLCNNAASRAARLRVLGIGGGLIALALVYGAWRLHAVPAESGTPMKIGLVSLQGPAAAPLHGAAGQAMEARYAEAIDRLANAGARIALIPEASFVTARATIPDFAERTRRNLTVAAGIAFEGDPRGERNMLTVLQPGVSAPATYNKHHLLVGLENSVPGDSYTMLGGTPRVGLAICKDMDFHDIGQAYASRDAQLLLVPAWDFIIDGWLHSRMAIMRGVESGFAIARSARNGRLTLSDDRGRVLAEASSEGRNAELVGDVPLRQTHTLYARWGNWFAWLDLATLLVLLGIAFVPARRGTELGNGTRGDAHAGTTRAA